MTRVGIVAEPLSLSCAIEAAMRSEPDIQIVSLLLGAGDSGLDGADVLLVSVGPAVDNDVEALGRAWNTGRSSRLVLLDVGAPDAAVLERQDHLAEEVALSEPSRQEVADAIRAVRGDRPSWTPRIALHLAPPGGRDPLAKDGLPPRADLIPLIVHPVDDRAFHRSPEGHRLAG